MRVLAVGTFCNTVGFSISFPYLPLIIREMGVSGALETWTGIIVGGFFTISFLMAPVWGGLADHFGRRSMVLRAGLGMGIGFALLGATGEWAWFLAFFVLVGSCNGYVPAAIALTATNTPMRHMGKALSNVQGGALLGTTFGPAAGAFLATTLPAYRHLFWVSALMSLLAGAIALIWVRENHQRPQEAFRLTVLADSRTILKVPKLGLLFFISFVFSITMFGSTTVTALYTLDMAGDPATLGAFSLETWVGVATLALTISSALALPLWGRGLDRFEPTRVLALSLMTGALAMWLFPFVRNPLELTGARLLLGLFAVGIQPAAVRLIKGWAPAGMDARTLALGTALQMLGNGAAPFIAGLIGPWLGLRAYFAFNALMLLTALLLWWRRGLSGMGKAAA